MAQCMCRTFSCSVGIISTSVIIIPTIVGTIPTPTQEHFVPGVGIFPTKFKLVCEYVLQNSQ